MGNIYDYLDWRGDIPFEVDPFNEVDNLMLSWLAYTDFEGVLINQAGDEWVSLPAEEIKPEEETTEESKESKEPKESLAEKFVDTMKVLIPEKFEDELKERLSNVPDKIKEKRDAAQPDWLRLAKAQAQEIVDRVKEEEIPDEADDLGIREAADRYFRLHTPEELENRDTFTHYAPLLLAKLIHSKRYEKLRMRNYENRVRGEDDLQMSAVTFEVGDGTEYIAYRGTDNTLVGWKEDFNFSYSSETTGQTFSRAYLNRAEGEKLRVGGHSKGGNFATYAAAFADEDVRNRILDVYSNDGPGFVESVVESAEFMEMLPKMVKIIPESSMIGILMNSNIEMQIIKSTEKRVMQHDATSWEVLGNRFVRAENRSADSFIVDRTIREWIYGVENEDRKLFIDNMFGILDSAGMTVLSDVGVNKMKSAVGIVKGYNSLEEADKKQIQAIMAKLVRSGAKVLREERREELFGRSEQAECDEAGSTDSLKVEEPDSALKVDND